MRLLKWQIACFHLQNCSMCILSQVIVRGDRNEIWSCDSLIRFVVSFMAEITLQFSTGIWYCCVPGKPTGTYDSNVVFFFLSFYFCLLDEYVGGQFPWTWYQLYRTFLIWPVAWLDYLKLNLDTSAHTCWADLMHLTGVAISIWLYMQLFKYLWWPCMHLCTLIETNLMIY